MNSTPWRPAPIIRFTALPPAPPQPITLSFAALVVSISSANMAPLPVPSPLEGPWTDDPPAGPLGGLGRLEQIPEPAPQVEPAGPVPVAASVAAGKLAVLGLRRVEHEPHAGREPRIGDIGREPAQSLGNPQPHRHLEHLLGELRDAGHER